MRMLVDVAAMRMGALVSKRPRRSFGAASVLAAAMLVLPALQGDFRDAGVARAQEKPRDQLCARWDGLASEAIVRLAHGKDDLMVRRVSDAVLRMRHARRSCQLGWALLACQQYRGIVQSAHGSFAPGGDLACESASVATAVTPDAAGRAESTVATATRE
jgi:hypothetical protein